LESWYVSVIRCVCHVLQVLPIRFAQPNWCALANLWRSNTKKWIQILTSPHLITVIESVCC